MDKAWDVKRMDASQTGQRQTLWGVNGIKQRTQDHEQQVPTHTYLAEAIMRECVERRGETSSRSVRCASRVRRKLKRPGSRGDWRVKTEGDRRPSTHSSREGRVGIVDDAAGRRGGEAVVRGQRGRERKARGLRSWLGRIGVSRLRSMQFRERLGCWCVSPVVSAVAVRTARVATPCLRTNTQRLLCRDARGQPCAFPPHSSASTTDDNSLALQVLSRRRPLSLHLH
jgi:hypothetical protein